MKTTYQNKEAPRWYERESCSVACWKVDVYKRKPENNEELMAKIDELIRVIKG